MANKLITLILTLFLTASWSVQAGFILFTDRAAFEDAVNSPLAFEGFNDSTITGVDISASSGYKKFRTTTSLVSEGVSAIAFKENDQVTFSFEHEVFALGFDLNELNTANLDYSDSAGHYIEAALEITEIWNASTFFGLISDTALTSFSLTGYGTSGTIYGLDALTFTQGPIAVSTPVTWHLLITALFALCLTLLANKNSKFKRPM